MKSYTTLTVWQRSINFVESIYKATELFPISEQFGLQSQIRRCSVSIPSNIAEGYGRKSKKEFSHFLRIAFGSSSELETQLIISHRLGYIGNKQFEILQSELIEIRKMLNKFISNLKTKD